jgi:hypothetical protein
LEPGGVIGVEGRTVMFSEHIVWTVRKFLIDDPVHRGMGAGSHKSGDAANLLMIGMQETEWYHTRLGHQIRQCGLDSLPDDPCTLGLRSVLEVKTP